MALIESTPRSGDCVLCNKKNTVRDAEKDGEPIYIFECDRCGKYGVERTLALTPQIPENIKAFLSAATRQNHENGTVTILRGNNLTDLAIPHAHTTVSGRLQKLLRFIALKCYRPGQVVQINYARDYPIADAENEAELRTYLFYLVSENMLTQRGIAGPIGTYDPTLKGWQAVEPQLSPGGIPGRCFVAMSFDESLREAYERGFEPGIRDAECEPFRADQAKTNKSITDTALSEIRLAEFVVADFTGQRQNVYFEAGFARGLGREVIWCCRSDEVGKLHFDTKHFGHVVWSDPNDLRVRLAESIRANIIRVA